MGLLSILKTVMGLDGSGSTTRSGSRETGQQDVDVSVEREPEPATESEAAVKGTADDTEDVTESEPEPDVDTEPAAEPEVEVGDEIEPDTDAEPEATPEAEPEAEPEPPVEVENADAAPDTLNGIGPAYAERLAAAGIDTVGDLAAADAADVAAETDLSEKRVQGWIDQARGE